MNCVNNIIERYSNCLLKDNFPIEKNEISSALYKENETHIRKIGHRVTAITSALLGVSILLAIVFAATIPGALWLVPFLALVPLSALLAVSCMGQKRALQKVEEKTKSPEPIHRPVVPSKRKMHCPFLSRFISR